MPKGVIWKPNLRELLQSLDTSHYSLFGKKARPTDVDGSIVPLVAYGWFKTTESMMNGMRLSDNENVKCVSFGLTMDARIWWESMELKYNVDEMTWAQFTYEFNDQFSMPT